MTWICSFKTWFDVNFLTQTTTWTCVLHNVDPSDARNECFCFTFISDRFVFIFRVTHLHSSLFFCSLGSIRHELYDAVELSALCNSAVRPAKQLLVAVSSLISCGRVRWPNLDFQTSCSISSDYIYASLEPARVQNIIISLSLSLSLSDQLSCQHDYI